MAEFKPVEFTDIVIIITCSSLHVLINKYSVEKRTENFRLFAQHAKAVGFFVLSKRREVVGLQYDLLLVFESSWDRMGVHVFPRALRISEGLYCLTHRLDL